MADYLSCMFIINIKRIVKDFLHSIKFNESYISIKRCNGYNVDVSTVADVEVADADTVCVAAGIMWWVGLLITGGGEVD